MEDIFIKILNAIVIFISVILGTGIITGVLTVIIINVGEVCERVHKTENLDSVFRITWTL